MGIETAIIAAAVVGAAATAYTGHEAAKAQKEAASSAAEAQKQVALAQLEAPIKAETAAADAAKARLKLKQASRSQTILTAPGGLEEAGTNTPTILGVG